MAALGVWLIEDDEAQSHLFSFVTQHLHPSIRVKPFFSAKEFLENFRRYSLNENSSPMIILSDLHLNDMNGLELLSLLRNEKETPKIPFILWSGSLEVETLKEAYRLGVTAYLQKPHGLSEYQDLLRSLLGFWSESSTPLWVPSS